MNLNPISAISSFLKNRKEKNAQKRKQTEKLLQDQLDKNATNFYEHGFNKIKFPILLVEGDINDENNEFEFDNYAFSIVDDLYEFAWTDWYHSPSLENEVKLIDSNGEIWDFKYNDEIKVCTPGSLLKKLELNEYKSFIIDCICWEDLDKVKDAIQITNSIASVLEAIKKNRRSFP